MSPLHKRSRREFLKYSSATAAAAALSTGGLSLARSAHAAGNEVMRVALIGCGGRGSGAAVNSLNADKSIRLVALADVFEEQARNSLKQLQKKKEFEGRVDVPDDRIFTGLDAYKKAIDCGIDVALICTPPGFRPMMYQYAVERGKHVFMEKPLCTDAPGFRSIMATNRLADQQGLKVVVGLQRHSEPWYQETIRRVQDGAIGKISFLRVYWNMGNIWAKARKPGDTEMMYQIRNWQYFYYFGGDHIVEQHVHNLDIANWVMNGHPVEANGMGGRTRRDEFPDMGHIYDHHFVEFTYADGTKLFSQCRQMPGCWNEVRELAHGDKGWADCSGVIEGANAWKWSGKKINSKDQEHVDLVDAIRQGKKLNQGWHGATSTMTAVLGRMATYSGAAVRWDDAVAKGPAIFPEKLDLQANPPIMPDKDGSYRSSVAVPGVSKAY